MKGSTFALWLSVGTGIGVAIGAALDQLRFEYQDYHAGSATILA